MFDGFKKVTFSFNLITKGWFWRVRMFGEYEKSDILITRGLYCWRGKTVDL